MVTVSGVSARDPRSVEIAANLAAVRQRIDRACAAAGRSPDEITLIAVTKTFPAADVHRLLALGLADVGENRDQEARAKAAAASAARWHFLGRLQRNKCRSVAGYATAVHSVDRPVLVEALARAAADRPAPLDVFVQVDLDPAGQGGGRGGAAPAAVPELAALVAAAGPLRLRGGMAVAPLGADPDPAYARLAEVAGEVAAAHPAAAEAAVRHGSTHLRIGTALLGGRAAPVR